MNYIGKKYTDAQAAEIMATAHGHLRRRDADTRQRNGAGKIVHKTNNYARVPALDPAPAAAATSEQPWWGWTQEHVDYRVSLLNEAVGEVIASERRDFQQALDKRDAAIEGLRREIKMLRDEVGLERGLAKLKAEVDQARQQARERELESLQRELGTLRNEIELKLNLTSELAAARAEVEELRQRAPDFKAELDGLREQVAKQEKTIRRLRGEQSQLAYAQKQLDAGQQQNHQRLKLTAIEVTSVGSATREILQRLQENGFDLVEEMQPPSGLAS